MRPVDLVLERADNARKAGPGYLVSCPLPSHGQGRGDRNPSVSVTEGSDNCALVHCQAGCVTEAVVAEWGLTMADLFERRNGHGGGGSYTSSKTTSTSQPATLENYAAYVALPEAFLKGLGLREYSHLGEPAVSMPYLDTSGEVLLTRSRVSITGKPKVKTRKGDKHRLYGLWKLEEALESGYTWAVEGESDTQTLWYHEEPVFGIPGTNGWKAEWAADLEGIERIYFVVEDEAGEECWRKLAASPGLRERLHRVDLEEGVKDVSELHKQDPDGFTERLRQAREAARAWLDIAETEELTLAREAWASCRDLAESPDILAEFSRNLERCRVVGERINGELLYLALTSRLLDKIVSVAVKGPSSGGKSYLVKSVASFFPETAVYQFTSFSEKTLYYTEEPLSHRVLILAEASGGGETQEYTIRTLLSEGRLEYEFVEKTAEGLRARRLCKEGPTGFITTTTRDKLHAENETRYLSLTVTDTREQTRRVFQALAEESNEEPSRVPWHALQIWLEGAERRVAIPYAGALAEKMGDMAVRLRRDFSVVLSLIRAHAVLHQASRSRDAEGRVVATLSDYSRIRELVADLISEGVEATVPKTVRKTVEAVENVIDGCDKDHATNKAVAEELDIDKAAAFRRVKTAIGRGYLENLEDRKGRPMRLVLGEKMPKDREILPAAGELEESVCTVDRDFGGINHPPPPSEAHIKGGIQDPPPNNTSTVQPREEFVL